MVAHFLIAFAAAVLAVLPALALTRLMDRRLAGAGTARGLERGLEPTVFLFRDGVLVDATSPARALLASLPGEGDWQRLSSWLCMRLPEFGALLPDLGDAARIELKERAGDSPLRLLADDLGDGLLRLTLADPAAEDAGILVDSLSLRAMEQELEILRSAMDHSPMLAWRQDPQGQVTWANSAYLNLAEVKARGQTVWPLPRIIDLSARPVQPATSGGARRMQVDHDGQSRWYDCHLHEIGGQTVAIALPADAAVRAERSLREFVQTLTKTFADLPIGLAIFDRDRNLQLFNPALIDLTGLATGFLTARPTLYAFLDRLREARMVPEPKDYRSWRNQMNTLEAAASSGHHVEMWSLPGGQTYRVTGRPHPDGAVAFLFEDITSEISLTRKFRADLSLGAEVLDALEDAVAVFGANGDLLISNRRYADLWDAAAPGTLEGHVQVWTDACGASPGLAALREALNAALPDEPLRGAMAGPAGGLLSWGLRGLSGARLLLSFAAPVPSLPVGRDAPRAAHDPEPAERAAMSRALTG
ncbi:PAS-domain containing protein [Paracoccus denitrificans]|jgi:PAS domain-containing protein|uniref:Putative PAS/PAC sensor protein n=1 Tax=Paracoccus denitrificans (strain Pd 1222) TaxID=318586 RepID=A1B5R8_PARDP|nr:PAS-domain containing protein [Paracoccus denitrificans]ABL70862.1 putative PAS/PAC sensor protein [Paracoccus denitrificans PD1222]MBB4627662.1 PAS domain-containing protein [Paracoccus denitrificans]MCU7428986.1 PAS-domain containing protein [Paracoccus denitrificans]QAR26181.1 PAS domain-containing protein [Paracoccus denitrificans]UPV95097.1 PAS-domain containing protein [Paracoccus denitrificans]